MRKHRFIPADGLHVILDFKVPGMPFVTTCRHSYQNTVTDVEVPAGFRTDFASVPWLFRRLFPQVGRYSRAALFHDAVYRGQLASRTQADALFLAIMRHDNVPAWQRWPLYLAVRFFGWIPWRERSRRKREAR